MAKNPYYIIVYAGKVKFALFFTNHKLLNPHARTTAKLLVFYQFEFFIKFNSETQNQRRDTCTLSVSEGMLLLCNKSRFYPARLMERR